MPATYSTEGKIETGLREIQCSGRNFVRIAKLLGIAISDGKLSEALSDKGRLDNAAREKLAGLLEEMRDLQKIIITPLDWSQAEEIREALSARREAKKLTAETALEIAAEVTTEGIKEN